MRIPPCDDPNCTCRSPELQWFTDQVLRRDATKTDYIVIPLVAGVLARSILADDSDDSIDPEGIAATRFHAESVVAIGERGRTEPWENDVHAYGIVANLVFCNWPSLLSWGGVAYQRTTLGLKFDARDDQRMATTIRYLGANPPPSLTESVIIAVSGSAADVRTNREMPLLGKAGRRLRVVLADRLRRQALLSWPKILLAAIDDWDLPNVQRLALHNAAAGDSAIHYVIDLTEQWRGAAGTEALRDSVGNAVESFQDPGARHSSRDDSTHSGEASAAEALINDAVTEIKHLRDQREAVQRERDTVVRRDARLQSRVESLEQQLAAERAERQALERENSVLRAERERYVERMAAEDALLEDAPPQPTDTFAGRRVLFFTGVESADTRAALAQGFWDLGAAQVDTYWTVKTRGPDTFPPDAIIAMDVSLMPHTTWNVILEKAKSAGAWCYWGKHGATTMARATAGAWTKRREAAERRVK
ncbi:MAG TPA: hypothetical protein VH277_12220 [Gemmatimonadaceae bacterium]|jgi:hypothetical protein|nr:hypothetical protein [Gemmatimonadaceae bacterium]